MRKVVRQDIVDYQTYGDRREDIRRQVIDEVKPPRRVQVGEYLTFLFENADTMRYQIQEMMRAERMVREADIQREIDTYNSLLGDSGELGCCLLVGIDDREQRDQLLRAWRELPAHLYLVCDDGSRIRASYDQAQVSVEKISAVQYLKFAVGTRVPVALGCDLPGLAAETRLSDEQRAALLADLTA